VSTIKDVALLAGVSFTTVSHVLNQTRPVSADARRRVLAAVDKLGYVPSAVARSLRKSETGIVGVLVPTVQNPFFAELVCGAEEVCRQAGYSVFLCNSDNDARRQQHYLRTLLEKRIDGLLVASVGEPEAFDRVLVSSGLPCVAMDRLMPGEQADRISLDNRAGAELATRHLLELGHRHIACISGPEAVEVSQARVLGWREALQAGQVEPGSHWLQVSDFSTAGGYQAAMALLRVPARPSAIFACNDLMALGVLRAAAELGLLVPAELSVMGFDNIELGGFVHPALSTVGCSIRTLGREAGRLLIDRIEKPAQALRHVQLSPQLVARESCAVVRARRTRKEGVQ